MIPVLIKIVKVVIKELGVVLESKESGNNNEDWESEPSEDDDGADGPEDDGLDDPFGDPDQYGDDPCIDTVPLTYKNGIIDIGNEKILFINASGQSAVLMTKDIMTVQPSYSGGDDDMLNTLKGWLTALSSVQPELSKQIRSMLTESESSTLVQVYSM